MSIIRSFFPLMEEAGAGGGGGAAGAGAGGASAAAQAGAGGAAGGAAGAGGGGGAASPGPWFSEWAKPDGTINHDAFQRLPDDIKHLAETNTLKNSKTVEDIFRSMANLQTLAGKKGLAPLPADAKPEVIAERNSLLRSIMGVPEKPTDYGITRPTDLPEGLWNQKAYEAAAAIAHKHNVSPAALKELVASQTAATLELVKAQETADQQFFLDQEKDFKAALIKAGVPYEKGLDLATRTARTFGIDPEKDPIFKNAQVRFMMQQVGTAIGEARLVTGAVSDPNAVGDRSKAEAIMHDKANPEYKIYWDANHPQNKAVKQKVNSWLAEAVRQERAASAQKR